MIDVTGMPPRARNSFFRQRHVAALHSAGGAAGAMLRTAAVLAAMAATSAPAKAQFFPPFWDEPVYVERGYREILPRGEVRYILRQHGFAMHGPLRRNGRVYVVDVANPRGVRMRVIVDAFSGRIVQRFVQGGPPRPPRNIGRRYSSVQPDTPFEDGPGAAPPPLLAPPVANEGQNVRTKKARRAKPAQSRKAIVRRDLPPIAAPSPAKSARLPGAGESGSSVTSAPAPGSTPAASRKTPSEAAIAPPAAPRVVYPGGPAPAVKPAENSAAKPASKPVAARSQPAMPDRHAVAPAPAGIAVPKVAPPQIAVPEPAKKPVATASRSRDDAAAKPTPKVRFAKPEKPGQTPARQEARGSLLPPPAPPAAVSIPVEKTARSNARPRVRVIPLDNPGQRRDRQPPVAVAPLQ